jgi:hypothetical protein
VQPLYQAKTSAPKRSRFSHGAALLATASILIGGVLAWFYLNRAGIDHGSEQPGLAERSSTQESSAAPKNESAESQPVFEVANGEPNGSPSELSAKPEQHRTLNARPKSYRSLASGSPTCNESKFEGRGVLNIENGTGEDAVLRLFDSDTNEVIRCPFVKAKDSAHVEEIPSGTYMLRYSSGLDWEDARQVFLWDPSYSQFEKQLTYVELQTGKEVQYKEIQVTLHPVVGGNVRTTHISREEFLGLNRQASNP